MARIFLPALSTSAPPPVVPNEERGMKDMTSPVAVDLKPRVRTDGPQTRTGVRVKQLVEDVKADLADIEDFLRQARERASQLEEEARGINGFSAACRGWGQQLDKILDDIAEEQEQVERTMLGTRRPIEISVDEDLRRQIVVARGA